MNTKNTFIGIKELIGMWRRTNRDRLKGGFHVGTYQS